MTRALALLAESTRLRIFPLARTLARKLCSTFSVRKSAGAATKSGEACCGRANKLPINASRTRTKGQPFRRISGSARRQISQAPAPPPAQPPSKKADFTSSYCRGNGIEGGAKTPSFSTGKWLENDGTKFLQRDGTTRAVAVSTSHFYRRHRRRN